MRHLSSYIALSLLAAAFAGCSSTDTGSPSTSTSGGQEPLTGPLAVYQSKIKALTNACTYDSTTAQAVAVPLVAADTLVVLSKRAVDSALLVNGATCVDADGVTALTTKVKSISVGPQTNAADVASDNTVLIDLRNGTFATKSGTSGGITIDIGAGTDEVAVLGATTADKLGCKLDATAGDMIGLKTATSADVTLTNAVDKLTFDLNDGDDTFDQGECITPMVVYGGVGKDTITASTEETPSNKATFAADEFHGGAGADTMSYAKRNTTVTLTLDGSTASGATIAVAGDEGDTIDGFETVTGGSGNDTIHGGSEAGITLYTLNGGDGNDTMDSASTHSVAFNGGAGTDTVTYAGRAASAVTVTMGDSLANDGIPSTDTDNVGSTVENLVGTDGNDSITGNSLNNTITPGKGADTVVGGAGDDTMVASEVLGTTDGDDTFLGGTGLDTVNYGARAVSVCVTLDAVYASAAWTGTKSGKCAATQVASTAALATVNMTTGANIPLAAAAENDYIGADVENAVGSPAADFIDGNASPNVLSGGGGADLIVGGAGNDQIDGSATCAADGVKVLCGGDPLDIFTCASAVSGTNYALGSDTCWKVQ
jgi:Ca2+-binding RTX toxin-like protein